MLRNLTAVALLTTVPAFASAEGISASLSASFGEGASGPVTTGDGRIVTPESVSVSGAAGVYAVSSSVATASSSGAASGATDDDDNTPMVSVTPDSTGSAYETEVAFAPSNFQQIADDAAAAAIVDLCNGTFSGSLSDTTVDVTPSITSGFGSVASATAAGLVEAEVADGTVTVTCP